jgi:hypothetical protein
MLLLPLLSPSPLPVVVIVTIAVAVPAVPIPFSMSVSTPFYYGWLLCVGRSGLDIMDIVITSQIIIIIIIVSLPSPEEELRAKTCKGERGHCGNCLGLDTEPLPCCGRAGESSKRMFSWLSL